MWYFAVSKSKCIRAAAAAEQQPLRDCRFGAGGGRQDILKQFHISSTISAKEHISQYLQTIILYQIQLDILKNR